MILTVCHWWIAGLWAVFLIVWIIAAVRMRSELKRSDRRRGVALRLALFLLIVVAVDLARRSTELHSIQQAVLHSVPLALTGAIVATLGAAVAFAARVAIGRNWGPPATRRRDTELVTSGPYAFVRHPIYSGILLMMVGSAIGLIPAWWLVALASGTYFFISARAEERYMTERFPDAYPAYRARTKMLIPFLL